MSHIICFWLILQFLLYLCKRQQVIVTEMALAKTSMQIGLECLSTGKVNCHCQLFEAVRCFCM